MPRRSFSALAAALVVAVAVVGSGALGVLTAPDHTGYPSAGVSDASAWAGSSLAHPGAAHHAAARAPSVARSSTGRAVSTGTHPSPAMAAASVSPPDPRHFTAAPAVGSTTYVATPAPMGVSDLGVNATGPQEYNTSSFEGQITLTSFSAFTAQNATNASYPSPDWVLIQLDAVAVNVTVPPASNTVSNGTFWVQNELRFNGTTVQLEDSIWNFSGVGAGLPPSSLEGVHGSVLYGEVYTALGPTFAVPAPSGANPLAIELFDNISTTTTGGGHTQVRFGYSAGGHSGTYDTVTFNGSASKTAPSEFLVDGSALTPAKLFYDAELDLGGNGNGANADLEALNGTATLLRNTSSGFKPVPSAFDFGVDASETALGVAVAYTGTTAQLTAGPSFLEGLWNTNGSSADLLAPSASPGWIQVDLDLTPSYGFLFATTEKLAEGPLAAAEYSFAPTDRSGVLSTDLPPPASGDPYVFAAWADGAATENLTVSGNSTTPWTLTLAPSLNNHDAPVYLRGTPQATSFAEAGIGQTGYSAAAKTLWLNATDVELAAPFLRVNEYDVPTFSLFAAEQVDLTINVNAFVIAPGFDEYTDEAGVAVKLANWTQGYFFYYGTGRFSVQNTTIEGNTTLEYSAEPVEPPATVEFYDTVGASVANVTAVQDAVGVTLLSVTSVRVTNLAVETGAVGVLADAVSGLTIAQASASGQDRNYVASTLATVNRSSSLTASALSVADNAFGLEINATPDVTVTGLTVTSGATGLIANDSSPATVKNLTVAGGPLSSAGAWANSSNLAFANLLVNGTGLNLSNDQVVTVTGGTAQAYGSSIVSSFYGSAHGTFSRLTALNGATAVYLVNASYLNVSEITARNGSVGAYVDQGLGYVSGTGFVSTNLSLALYVNGSVSPKVTAFAVSNQSLGAYIANSSNIYVGGITAENATLNPSPYFYNVTDSEFPIAGVALDDDSSPVTVANVSATEYPFAVWSNDSAGVTISHVTDWYGYEAVYLNYTNGSKVTEVFAYSDYIGVAMVNCTDTTLGTSTLELSGGVGLWVDWGKGDAVRENNFVGNNGSSVVGTFNGSRLQAWANNTTSSPPSFENNYWSDRTGSAAYVVNSSVKDPAPLSAFYSTYLEFTERGLPAGAAWLVDLAGRGYATNVSLLVVPGWAIANGSLAFTVPTVDYLDRPNPNSSMVVDYPAHPASGSVLWTGANEVETIVFGSPSSSGASFPMWIVAAAVIAVVAVVAVLLLLRGRRRASVGVRAWDASQGPDLPPSGPR